MIGASIKSFILGISLVLFSFQSSAQGDSVPAISSDIEISNAYISLVRLDKTLPKAFIESSENLYSSFLDLDPNKQNQITIALLKFENFLLKHKINKSVNSDLVLKAKEKHPGLKITSIKERTRFYMKSFVNSSTG